MKTLKRIVTALSTAALVAAAIWFVPARFIIPAMIAAVALVHLEFGLLVARKYAILVWPGVVAGILYLLDVFYIESHSALLGVVCALSLIVLFSRCARPVETLATTILGFIYLPWLLSYFVMIPKIMNPHWLLYVIAIVKFSDMGGFALGMLFGRHKMCPSISPNKSWEGLFGSVLAGILMSLAFTKLTGYAVPKSVAMGVAAALLGTFGDLVESRIKREIGVKDSATFMPAGLGGFLDMFDSLVFAPAVLFNFL